MERKKVKKEEREKKIREKKYRLFSIFKLTETGEFDTDCREFDDGKKRWN